MTKERKIKHCKSCSKELDKSAKICPACGKDQRSFFGKHKILTAILIVLALGVVGALGGGSPTEEAEEKQIELTATAKEISQDYHDNEVKADKKYKDKYSEITGKVTDISVTLGQVYIVLDGVSEFDETILAPDVQCFFSDDEKEIEKLEELKKGDEVTVIGDIDGMSMNVGVNNCKLK